MSEDNTGPIDVGSGSPAPDASRGPILVPEAPIIRPDHDWVGAAYLSLDPRQAKHAERRGSVRVAEKVKVEVLESPVIAAAVPT
jgi:hypothetical protein